MFFTYNHNGYEFEVEYSERLFTVYFHSDFGLLKQSRGMLYLCRKNFTEESIRQNYCLDYAISFEKILDFLNNNPDFIKNAKNDLSNQLKSVEEELNLVRKERLENKKLFKEGKISEKGYAVFCKKVKDKKLQIYSFKWDFFRNLEKKTNMDLRAIEHLILGEE